MSPRIKALYNMVCKTMMSESFGESELVNSMLESLRQKALYRTWTIPKPTLGSLNFPIWLPHLTTSVLGLQLSFNYLELTWQFLKHNTML